MKVGFIGGGKMAEAIIAAWVRTGGIAANGMVVSDIAPERRDTLQSTYGVMVTSDNAAVIGACDTVVLAVKPQVLDEVVRSMAGDITERHLVLSIAAGKRLASLERLVPRARVGRVMPNLPATVGEGMSAFCGGTGFSASDREDTIRLLSSFGRVVELPEVQFDAFTALAGSGPAFVARFIEALALGAEALGIDAESSRLAARQTVRGTAALLLAGALDEEALVSAVSSPGGTTVAGRAVLEASELKAMVADTLAAAAQRGAELSGECK